MATYTVREEDTWFSLASKLGVDVRTLRRLNKGTKLNQGVLIRTGGATATRPLDINPWGLGVGEVPSYAAGTTVALDYLAAISGAGVTTEEVPGITPVGGAVWQPGQASTQAGMWQPGQVSTPLAPTPVTPPLVAGGYSTEGASVTPTTAAAPITMAGLTGAGIGPQQATPAPQAQPVSAPQFQGAMTDIIQPAAPSQPFAPGVSSFQGFPGAMTDLLPPPPTTIAPPGAEYVVSTPTVSDTTIMPIDPQSPQAVYLAARWTGEAIQAYGRAMVDPLISSAEARKLLPDYMSTVVALHFIGSPKSWTTSTGVTGVSGGWLQTSEGEYISSVAELFNEDNLSYDEFEPGKWKKNPTMTYSGGYTGAVGYAGRRYGRGRGARGGGYGSSGGTQYGPRLVQWRIAGFG